MSTGHTQGKLVVRGYSLYTEDHTPVADTCLTTSMPDKDHANALRIAACWNACESIADPENVIPRLLALNEINPALAGQVATLQKQKTELLAALNHIKGASMDITCDRRSIREAAQAAINDIEGTPT